MSGTTKTVAERLREVEGGGCVANNISKSMFGEDIKCADNYCPGCTKIIADKLADMIEAEQSELRKQNGVDVDALLKLEDMFCHWADMAAENNDACQKIGKNTLLNTAERIHTAVKGAKPQLPEGVIWPRFEDGELVKPFDKLPGFDSGGVQKFIWTSSHNGAWQLQDAEGHMLNVMHGEFVKRPEPEVLDADGVPIKVGDTVWHEADGSELIVVGFRDEKEDGEVMVDVEGKWFCVRQFSLTHRKPDTFKSVVEEMLTDFDSHDTIELDGYFDRLRKLLGGE